MIAENLLPAARERLAARIHGLLTKLSNASGRAADSHKKRDSADQDANALGH